MRAKTGFANTLRGGGLAASLAAGTALISSAAYADQVKLLETGSTLLLPLFNLWAADYQQAHPDVQIGTQGTGSGNGIAQAISGGVQIGASDAYMSDAQMKSARAFRTSARHLLADDQLQCTGPQRSAPEIQRPPFGAIYEGKVKYWDDPLITQMNPALSLPHNEIVPVHRTDGSGDTFIFTQYLSSSTPDWSTAPVSA